MQGFFAPKPFDKILWIDTNDVSQENMQFQFIFGKDYIKLFRLTKQAHQYALADPHSKFIVMISHKIFMSQGSKQKGDSNLHKLQEIPNVYPNFIIFCGDKKKGNKNPEKSIQSFQDDVFEVKETIEGISKKLLANSMGHNKSKLLLMTDEKFESDLKNQALKIIRNLYWESIEVQILNEETLRDTLDQLDHKSEVIVFSFVQEISAQTIADSFLGEYQIIKHWHMITDEEEASEDPQSHDITLYHVNIKKLKEKMQSMNYQF